MVDCAINSEHFGYLDSQILDTPCSYLELNEVKLSVRNQLRKGTFRTIYKTYSRNGEGLILKKIRNSSQLSNEKQLYLLSVEARISKIIGTHQNICHTYGIFLKDRTPYLVQEFISNVTLQRYFSMRPKVTEIILASIITGLAKVILYIHSRGFLINNLSLTNIALNVTTEIYVPVLLSLSIACREKNAKPLSMRQQDIYKNHHHLPQCVLNGSQAPSKYSDLFSYGQILLKLGICDLCVSPEQKTKISDFGCSFYEMEHTSPPEEQLLNVIKCFGFSPQ